MNMWPNQSFAPIRVSELDQADQTQPLPEDSFAGMFDACGEEMSAKQLAEQVDNNGTAASNKATPTPVPLTLQNFNANRARPTGPVSHFATAAEVARAGNTKQTPSAAQFGPINASPEAAANSNAAKAAGYARGYASGYGAGQRKAAEILQAQQEQISAAAAAQAQYAQAQLEDTLNSMYAAVRALEERDGLVLSELAETLTDVALQIAEAVLGAEITDAGKRARTALRRALAAPEELQVNAVRMNPDDIAALDAAGIQAPVPIEADMSLAPGDAIALLPEGYLDARITTAVARVTELLVTSGDVCAVGAGEFEDDYHDVTALLENDRMVG